MPSAAPDPSFPPLPDIPDADAGMRPGGARRVGIEIEFGGLEGAQAARIVRETLGGEVSQEAAGSWTIAGTRIGEVELYLDSAYRPGGTSRAAQNAVDIARRVVPMEIVTDPVAQADLPRIEALLTALAEAGAEGSTERLVYGFGLHLNVALADPESGADLPNGVLAFALLEPWLRARDPLDISRRALPFTAPFPPDFARRLAQAGPGLSLTALWDAVDAEIGDRNHGLDVLPAYAHLAPGRFDRWPGERGAVSARPAYHYRAPETRLGTPGWSLGYEWRRWVLVERVAADPARLAELCAVFADLQDVPLLPAPQGWRDRVSAALGPLAALAPEGGPAPEVPA